METDSEYLTRTGYRWGNDKRGGNKITSEWRETEVGTAMVSANTLAEALNKAEAFLSIHGYEATNVKA